MLNSANPNPETVGALVIRIGFFFGGFLILTIVQIPPNPILIITAPNYINTIGLFNSWGYGDRLLVADFRFEDRALRLS